MQQQGQHDEEEQKHNSLDIHALLEKFECTVCLEVAKEPVVTECGHLFCWPCIYKWLNQNNEYLVCPNCKNGIKKDMIRPLYARNEDDSHQKQRDTSIPKRTLPARQNPQRNQNHLGGVISKQCINHIKDIFQKQKRVSSANLSLGVSFAGYGYFPSLYGLLNVNYMIKREQYIKINFLITLVIQKYYHRLVRMQIDQYRTSFNFHLIKLLQNLEHVSPEVAKQPLFERLFYVICILCVLFLVFCI